MPVGIIKVFSLFAKAGRRRFVALSLIKYRKYEEAYTLTSSHCASDTYCLATCKNIDMYTI